jgi:hypothetical protein
MDARSVMGRFEQKIAKRARGGIVQNRSKSFKRSRHGGQAKPRGEEM